MPVDFLWGSDYLDLLKIIVIFPVGNPLFGESMRLCPPGAGVPESNPTLDRI